MGFCGKFFTDCYRMNAQRFGNACKRNDFAIVFVKVIYYFNKKENNDRQTFLLTFGYYDEKQRKFLSQFIICAVIGQVDKLLQ